MKKYIKFSQIGVLIKMYVVDLKKVDKRDILLVGGKGANLGEMLQAEINVPPGFCITSKAYDKYVSCHNIQVKIDEYVELIYNNVAMSEEYSKKIQELILKYDIPKDMEEEILNCYLKLGQDVRVAVRSSATAEDLEEASFAGQQETFLNVYGKEDLFDKVKKCWASLWNARAIIYRKQKWFHKEKLSLAIVVQQMIEGEISGVLFTVNPTNVKKDEMMINAAYGLGEAVVSGMVTPDTYICSKSNRRILSKEKGSKEISIVYDKLRGTRNIENTLEKRESFSLKENQIKEMIDLGLKIERHYGAPQDIEWTMAGGKAYILQSRAITTLNNTVTNDEGKHTNLQKKVLNNLLEHWPKVPYPLDFYGSYYIMEQKNRAFKEIGIDMKNQIIMKEDGEFEVQATKVRITPKIIKLPFTIKNYINTDINNKKSKEGYEAVLKELNLIENKNLSTYTKLELSEQLKDVIELSSKIAYLRFRYSIFPSVVIGKIIGSKLKKIDGGLTEYDLLSGLKYKTLTINEDLMELAELAKGNKDIYELICNGTIVERKLNNEEVFQKLKVIYPKFFQIIEEFLKKNGWKSSMAYFPFSAISWREDHNNFMDSLRIMIKGNSNNSFNINKYSEIQHNIIEKLGQVKGSKLLKRIEEYRFYHVQREESLYQIERCYGLSRKIVQEIADRLSDILENRNDILYLTLEEIYEACSKAEAYLENVRYKIRIRKQGRKNNIALWNSIEIKGEDAKGTCLKGICGSRGKAKGKVCIINEVSEFNKLQEGDILVCKFTDPIWTPLFAIAKAVVSDTGGPLSHSAIVAREYNIPAVLGTGQATSFLKDGEIIIVDGDKGEVIKTVV